MTNPNDPAFLNETVNSDGSPQKCGLTKREWLAGMALQGLIAMAAPLGGERNPSPKMYAEYATYVADALIAELSKNEKV